MRLIDHRLSAALAAALCLIGCGRESSETATQPDPILDADPVVLQELQTGISDVMNDAGTRYMPLPYQSSEDLLAILDQVEAHLSGQAEGPYPQFLAGTDERPGLDEQEELDHFRETIRRWEAQTGRNLRDTIEPLKAEVEARDPDGPSVHPEFHKRFSAAFDDFIKIEVEEMRERRNRFIHEQVEPLLDEYRTDHPDLVRHFEAILNKPPYNLPASADRTSNASRGDDDTAGARSDASPSNE